MHKPQAFKASFFYTTLAPRHALEAEYKKVGGENKKSLAIAAQVYCPEWCLQGSKGGGECGLKGASLFTQHVVLTLLNYVRMTGVSFFPQQCQTNFTQLYHTNLTQLCHTNFIQLCMNVLKDPARSGLIQGEDEDLLQDEEEDARPKGSELIDAARERAGRGLLKPLPPRITQVFFAS